MQKLNLTKLNFYAFWPRNGSRLFYSFCGLQGAAFYKHMSCVYLGWIDDARLHHVDVLIVQSIVSDFVLLVHHSRYYFMCVDASVQRYRVARNTQRLSDYVNSYTANTTIDNVKFPDGSRHSSTALGMLSVTHIMPVLVLLTVLGVGVQQYMIQNHILNNKTQQSPTKYVYGHKYAVYNKQF